ncbi:efflux RND transporter permease subunit [Hyphomonas sp.]|uniref:efflux RND transporter permease subunit n=1 Tax=Hyphomonas sp. TaxID=87 RepID=UPI0025BA4814|nr:efflux RND transporter permease subunit [Hyphomonas sp.]
MIRFIANFVTRFPRLVVALAMTATAALGYFATTGLTLRVSLEEMLPADHPNVALYKEFSDQFGGVNTVLVKVENLEGDIYDPDFLKTYQSISDEFFFHPSSIRPLFEAANLRKTRAVSGTEGQIVVSPLMWPEVPQTNEEMEKFRTLVRSQFLGSLVSLDEHSMLISAEFASDTDTLGALRFVDEVRAKYASQGVELSVVGRPVLLGTVKKYLPHMLLIFAASVLVSAAVLYGFFRNWIGVAIPMVVASTVTIWGFGVIGLVGYNLDPLLLLLPFFVFATVLSHSVQFVSRVFDELAEGGTLKEAVRVGLERLLFPSTAAVITDAAGFTVLALVTIPSIQSLALICTLWLLSLTPGIIVAAAVMALLPKPSRFRTSLPGQNLLGSVFGLNASRYLFVPAFALALVFGFFTSQHLKIGDAVGSPILWQDSRYNEDVESINSSFSRVGTDVMQAYFSGEGEIMLDPRTYEQIEAFDRYIYSRVPVATRAQSLVPIVKNINMVLWEGDPSYQFIPGTEEEIGLNIYMFRSGGEPGDFAAYTNPEWSIGKLSIFASEHSAETVNALMSAGNQFLDSYPFEPDEPHAQFAGGQIGLIKATNDEIEHKENVLLVAIIVVILINLLWLYRSPVLAMVVIAVLTTSHYITMSVMAGMDVGMNLNTLPLAALGLGRGVDYSIYMADRIRDEMRNGLGFEAAAKRSFNTSGTAVIVTALTMIIPLLPWYFLSPIRFQAEMGVLLAIILLFNMIGALTIVPAAIGWLKPRGFAFERRGMANANPATETEPQGAVNAEPLAAEKQEYREEYKLWTTEKSAS